MFDYEARYTAGLTTYFTPARLEDEPARQASGAGGGGAPSARPRDLSRTDAVVGADGTVQFLEVNVSPGLTETSMLPMAAEAAGEDLGVLYSRLIEAAIVRGQ